VVSSSAWVWFGNDLARTFEDSTPSRSLGTTSAGRLEHGKRLPTRGPNFRAYSRLGAALGRNAVHGRVRETVVAAYARAYAILPDEKYVYGETGWPSGGPFPPHRSHEDGLSVDFMVPVRTREGTPTELPTWPWQQFGYAIDFDSAGSWRALRIDFPAIVVHLQALDDAARQRGLKIGRVIFAPELVEELSRVPGGQELVARLPFMRGRPWVRHDEHYHVDFVIRAAQQVHSAVGTARLP
jgi:penicillin-insensitive murein endopeptidase